MSLPDFFGLVPRQWRHNPLSLSPRAEVAEAFPPPTPKPAATTPSTTRAENFILRPRAAFSTANGISETSTFNFFTTGASYSGSWDTTSATMSPNHTKTPFTSSLTWTASPTPLSPPITEPVGFSATSSWTLNSPTFTPPPPPTPTPTPRYTYEENKPNTGVIIGSLSAALVIMLVIGLWYFRWKKVKKRAQYGSAGPKKWEDGEKGLHQTRRQQQGYSSPPSPTHSFYGGNGYGHSDAYYYYQYNNNNNNNDNLHNSSSIIRGPQNLHSVGMDDDMRAVKVHPQTLPNDTAVYWPPPPGPQKGLPSLSPSPPPPFSPFAASEPSLSTEAEASTATSVLLKRSATRNPQDHQRQEQLEHLLMMQRRQIRELQELQQHHQRENPLSGVSAPHAPTKEDRQIWQQSDRIQRQQWLQQQQPVYPGGNSRGGIIVSGPVGAVRDPQDWGVVDDEPPRQDERGVVMQARRPDDSEEVEGGEQSLRAYIAQMKADYEEQFRKHQEEIDRLRAEQETQLQMLREQIKE